MSYSFSLTKRNGSGESRPLQGFFTDMLKQVFKGSSLADLLRNTLRYYSHSGMTEQTREEKATDLANQQILNDEEYARKIDFHSRFETPEAMVRQYKQAGLNPMMLAGSGAGVSASGGIGSPGSAGSGTTSGGDLLGVLSGLLGIGLQSQRVANDYEVAKERNEITRSQGDARNQYMSDYYSAYREYLSVMTTGKGIENQQSIELFPLRKANLENQNAQIAANTKYLQDALGNLEVQRRLMESNISLNTANQAILDYNKIVVKAISEYADRYYKAAAEYQEAMSEIAKANSDYEKAILERKKEMFEYELYNVLYDAALKAKGFENFSKSQLRDWIKTIGSTVGIVAGVGVAAGKAFLGAGARMISPPMFPGTAPTYIGGTGSEFGTPTMY